MPKLISNNNLKRILINCHKLKANKDKGRDDPCISVQLSGGIIYGHEVSIQGPSRVVYSPDKPLKCGASIWIETKAEVEVF